jgi:formyl-CoA transferase/succinyl-CoA--D-citramalate CoA-transferase
VIGTLAALQERHRSGRGQEVDVAIYEAVFALMESTVADYELGGVVRGRSGGHPPDVAPSTRTHRRRPRHRDRGECRRSVRRLAAAMERPDLAARSHRTRPRRRQHELDDEIAVGLHPDRHPT